MLQRCGEGIVSPIRTNWRRVPPPPHPHPQPSTPTPTPTPQRDGLHIDLGFFRDVLIPPHGLPEPSYWHEDDEVGCARRGCLPARPASCRPCFATFDPGRALCQHVPACPCPASARAPSACSTCAAPAPRRPGCGGWRGRTCSSSAACRCASRCSPCASTRCPRWRSSRRRCARRAACR